MPAPPELSARISDRDPVHRARCRHADLFGRRAGGRFLSPFNLSLVLQQVTIIAILGMAQTLVILTAGIDLSRRRDHGALVQWSWAG